MQEYTLAQGYVGGAAIILTIAAFLGLIWIIINQVGGHAGPVELKDTLNVSTDKPRSVQKPVAENLEDKYAEKSKVSKTDNSRFARWRITLKQRDANGNRKVITKVGVLGAIANESNIYSYHQIK